MAVWELIGLAAVLAFVKTLLGRSDREPMMCGRRDLSEAGTTSTGTVAEDTTR
jgi:hypothetical protein